MDKAERHLRVFFSVDICGSTLYKAKNATWTEIYLDFFNDFPVQFFSSVKDCTTRYKTKHLPKDSNLELPILWKLLGDEIIFSAKIASKGELFVYTKAFYEAFHSFDTSLSVKNLRFKASGWTAGFPIRNKMFVPVKGDLKKFASSATDFIGPDMDIGFRIGSLSRQGRLVISLDFADIMAQVSSKENFNFYHVGWSILKGVFDNNPYPVFWIANDRSETKLLPWEEAICPFTKNYIDQSDISAKNLRLKIQQIRESLPHLNLFEPYFDLTNAPESHKKQWKEADLQHEREASMLDFGAN